MNEVKRKSTKNLEVVSIKPTSVEVKIIAISFDKNNNLYGVSSEGKLYYYEYTKKTWENV